MHAITAKNTLVYSNEVRKNGKQRIGNNPKITKNIDRALPIKKVVILSVGVLTSAVGE